MLPGRQDEILNQNREFIDRAQLRAEAASDEGTPKPITLSGLEEPKPSTSAQDLQREALAAYRDVAQIAEAVGTPRFNRRLMHQGLLKDQRGRAVPTGSGLLLFGSEPRLPMPQAGLLGTIHFPDGSEETRDFVTNRAINRASMARFRS